MYLPLGIGGLYMLFTEIPQLAVLLHPATPGFTSWTFYAEVLIVSLVFFFVPIFIGFLLAVAVPRLLKLTSKPDRVYPLYGFHYWVHRTIARRTNAKFFKTLFGDSSTIVHYLRCIGYNLSPSRADRVELRHAGEARHPVPDRRRDRNGGRRRAVGRQCRLLEHVLPGVPSVHRATQLPRQPHHLSRAGQNGRQLSPRDEGHGPDRREMREGVGLLGSPSFEIPRSVERDTGSTT